jgi:hypothetical protein
MVRRDRRGVVGDLSLNRERRDPDCGASKVPEFGRLSRRGRPIVASLRSLLGQTFWTDDFSLIGSDLVDISRVLTPSQVTDTYLLALARAHEGKLATFDRRLASHPVRDGRRALHVIGIATQREESAGPRR